MSHDKISLPIRSAVVVMFAVVAISVGAKPIPAKQGASKQNPARTMHPAAVIDHFDKTLIESMKAGKTAGFEKRYKILEPVIDHGFDFRYIAQTILGPKWKKLNKQQKQTFIRTFKHHIVSTYAARFNEYSGEKFDLGNTQQYQQLKVVHTQFEESNGTPHEFDYLMRQTSHQWKIVNVLADGVSDLSLKRSQYTQILKKKGFGGLIKRIKTETDNLKNGTSSQ